MAKLLAKTTDTQDGGSAISCLSPEVAQIVMIDECLFKYNEKGIESRGQA